MQRKTVVFSSPKRSLFGYLPKMVSAGGKEGSDCRTFNFRLFGKEQVITADTPYEGVMDHILCCSVCTGKNQMLFFSIIVFSPII